MIPLASGCTSAATRPSADGDGQRLPFASSVQYVVVPSQLSGTGKTLFSSIAGHFHLVACGGASMSTRESPPKVMDLSG